jgi:hypothetical protein
MTGTLCDTTKIDAEDEEPSGSVTTTATVMLPMLPPGARRSPDTTATGPPITVDATVALLHDGLDATYHEKESAEVPKGDSVDEASRVAVAVATLNTGAPTTPATRARPMKTEVIDAAP